MVIAAEAGESHQKPKFPDGGLGGKAPALNKNRCGYRPHLAGQAFLRKHTDSDPAPAKHSLRNAKWTPIGEMKKDFFPRPKGG